MPPRAWQARGQWSDRLSRGRHHRRDGGRHDQRDGGQHDRRNGSPHDPLSAHPVGRLDDRLICRRGRGPGKRLIDPVSDRMSGLTIGRAMVGRSAGCLANRIEGRLVMRRADRLAHRLAGRCVDRLAGRCADRLAGRCADRSPGCAVDQSADRVAGVVMPVQLRTGLRYSRRYSETAALCPRRTAEQAHKGRSPRRAARIGAQPITAAGQTEPDGGPGVPIATALQVGETGRRYRELPEHDCGALHRREVRLAGEAGAQPCPLGQKQLFPLVAQFRDHRR
ncbi:hypothetical protein IP91_01840 [Pseudoduganella lurida]|uniref:Uncharacterized protein n=1 Tax=Pseudoduganella lurida TaxID=1036180 RepID=A0A562RFA6_9BURK|nr:hypothetical protein IP91_01840 [Pseudoduganella lurida]